MILKVLFVAIKYALPEEIKHYFQKRRGQQVYVLGLLSQLWKPVISL